MRRHFISNLVSRLRIQNSYTDIEKFIEKKLDSQSAANPGTFTAQEEKEQQAKEQLMERKSNLQVTLDPDTGMVKDDPIKKDDEEDKRLEKDRETIEKNDFPEEERIAGLDPTGRRVAKEAVNDIWNELKSLLFECCFIKCWFIS